jgi:hypothetical protein
VTQILHKGGLSPRDVLAEIHKLLRPAPELAKDI